MIFVLMLTSVFWGLILFFIPPMVSNNSAATQFGLIGLVALFIVFIVVLTIAVTELAALKIYNFCIAKLTKEKKW